LRNAQYKLFTLFAPLKLSSGKKKNNPRKNFVEKFSSISPFHKKLPPFKMAAYKGSDEDVQRVLSVAQQCKCENSCIDYLKLQSELNDRRLELKSVKEIINILDRCAHT